MQCNATHIICENGAGALEFALPGEALGHESHALTLFGPETYEFQFGQRT
jgi:hypothetical protein